MITHELKTLPQYWDAVKRERSIGAEEELRRLAGEVQAMTRFTEDGLMHGQIDAEDLIQRADAIRDAREKGKP